MVRTLPNAIIVLLAIVSLTCCSPWRSAEALDLIRDVAAGETQSALKRETPEPIRQTIAYTVAGRHYLGDIYRPGEGQAKAAAVFVPGANNGKDDPRLVAFAKSFARMGFLVLVPEIPNLRACDQRLRFSSHRGRDPPSRCGGRV